MCPRKLVTHLRFHSGITGPAQRPAFWGWGGVGISQLATLVIQMTGRGGYFIFSEGGVDLRAGFFFFFLPRESAAVGVGVLPTKFYLVGWSGCFSA